MAPEDSSPPVPATAPAPPRWKYRLRFRKIDGLRLVSHHDLMHLCERLLRRAEIPFAVTQGFHPQPKITFAQALALGIAGLDEIVELELTESFDPEDLRERLNRRAPPGLEFTDSRRLESKSSLQPRRAFYRLVLDAPVLDLDARIAQWLALDSCWVYRPKPEPRRINLRPYVHELVGSPEAISMILWITPIGSARPVEIIEALGLRNLLDDGAILERTRIELLDEVPLESRPLPELGEVTRPATAADLARKEPVRIEASATPLFANPLSFET